MTLNIPIFKSESEEVAWWNEHRAEVEAEMRKRIRVHDRKAVPPTNQTDSMTEQHD